MRGCRDDLRAAGRVDDELVRRFPDQVDLALADGFLEIQIAEHEGAHFYTSNPALWTGEAIFSVLSLVTRDGRADRSSDSRQRRARLSSDSRVSGRCAGTRWSKRHTPGGPRRCASARRPRSSSAAACRRGSPDAERRRPASPTAVAAAAAARDAFRSFAAWIDGSLPTADRRCSAPDQPVPRAAAAARALGEHAGRRSC